MRKRHPRKARHVSRAAAALQFSGAAKDNLQNSAITALTAFIQNYANINHYTIALVLCNTLEMIILQHINGDVVTDKTHHELTRLKHIAEQALTKLYTMRQRHKATGDWFLMNEDQEALELAFSGLLTISETISTRELATTYSKAEQQTLWEIKND